MNVFYLALFGLLIFLVLAFLRKWFDNFILFAFSIGAACNANIYHALSTPVSINVGGMNIIFALDSILFTLFMHTLIVKYLHYSLKEAQNLAFASIVAIIISALFEVAAKASSNGFSIELLEIFSNYIFSALGSLIGIWLMFLFLEHTKDWNIYLRIAIAILFGSVVNSTIYYVGVVSIDPNMQDSIWGILLGSYIGKFYAILLSLLSYFINGKIWVPTDQKIINHHDLEK